MQKPSVYILHGDDLFAFQRHLKRLLAEMGDPGMADLNLARLDGREASEDEIYNAANALPFLSERRMVILSHPFGRLKSEPARVRFREMLTKLPPSTALVLYIEDVFERGDWASLGNKHWLRKWMTDAGAGKHELLFCAQPSPRDMPDWILREARTQGGQFTPDAAYALAQHVGRNTRAASLEIDKLFTYVDRARVVEIDDVELLSAQSGQADIFTMIDALAAGNTSMAQNLLHRLLEEQDEFSLFGMIVRQFRQILQAREILDEGKGLNGVMQEIDRRDFIAKKLVSQAERFTMTRLEAIYHHLIDIDEAVKTSQSEWTVALDVLIVKLAR